MEDTNAVFGLMSIPILLLALDINLGKYFLLKCTIYGVIEFNNLAIFLVCGYFECDWYEKDVCNPQNDKVICAIFYLWLIIHANPIC